MTPTENNSAPQSTRIWPALLIILFGFTLSFSFYLYSKNNEENREKANFEQYIHVQNLRIQALMGQSKMLLQTYYAFLNSKENISREEYALFSEVALKNHPEIFAVHWAPRIKNEDRQALEDEFSVLGLAPLGIFDVSPDAGTVERAPKRKEYFPITYAAPLEKNRKAIGLDPLARPYNTITIREAARHGRRDTTQPFPIVQDPSGPLSVAIYHPIYQQEMPLEIPTERWEALKGYIILMLRPGQLLEQYKNEFAEKGIAVRLVDISDNKELKIYPKPDSDADKQLNQLQPPMSIQFDWQVPGRTWRLTFYSVPTIAQSQASYLPHLLLTIMSLLTLVLASFIVNSDRQSEKLKRANIALIERQKELDELAYYDQLTGLPNRSLLNEHLKRILSLEEREESFSAICVMDLDGFKDINDIYGHDAGDLVLQEVSKRLLDKLRDSDVAARVGGDEFVFILTGLHLLAPIDEIIGRIIDTISLPIFLPDNNASINVYASVGISLSKSNITQQSKPNKHPVSDRLSGSENLNKADMDLIKRKALLKKADVAMYRAKKQGKGKHILFQSN